MAELILGIILVICALIAVGTASYAAGYERGVWDVEGDEEDEL